MDSWKRSNRTTNEVINNATQTWEHSFRACPKSAPRNGNVFWTIYRLRTLVAISLIERIPPVIRSSAIGFIGVEAATVRNNNHWLTCLPLNAPQPPVHLLSMIIVNDRPRPPRLLSGDRGDTFSPFDFLLCFCSLSFCKRIHIWKGKQFLSRLSVRYLWAFDLSRRCSTREYLCIWSVTDGTIIRGCSWHHRRRRCRLLQTGMSTCFSLAWMEWKAKRSNCKEATWYNERIVCYSF